MTGPGPAGSRRGEAHPGEDLSALLDGELGPDDAVAVRSHVDGCRACAEELEGVRLCRRALRTLPGLDPPPGLVDRAMAGVATAGGDGGPVGLVAVAPDPTPARAGTACRRRDVPALAGVATVAAGLALFLVAVVAPAQGRYEPQVEAAVGTHVAALAALSAQDLVATDGGADPLEPAQPVVPTTTPRRDLQDLPAPYRAPRHLDGGYELVDAFAHSQGLQLVYEGDRYGLSVFEAPGRLDLEALPPGGRRLEVAGAPGWQWGTDEVAGRVVVFERDGLLVTVVGDEPGEAVLDAARSIPEPRPLSLPQRLGRVAEDVLAALSP